MAGEQGPWAKYAQQDSGPWEKYSQPQQGTPITDSATVEAAPTPMSRVETGISRIGHAAVNSSFPYIHPFNAGSEAVNQIENTTAPIENYTQEGRSEHPVLSRIGDVTSRAKEMGNTIGPEVMTLGFPEASEDTIPSIDVGGTAAKVFRDAKTGKVTVSPSSLAERFIPQRPEVLERQQTEEMARKMKDAEQARQKELSNWGRLRANEERMNRVGQVGSTNQEAGIQPPVLRVPAPTGMKRITPEQIPGPDTAGKGNLLTPLARSGEEGAADELLRRGRRILYTVPTFEK